MFFISKKINKIGFSLVEMMLAVGAMAGVALVVMQLSKTTAQTQVDAQSTLEYMQLTSQLSSMFANDYDCIASFKDVTFNGSSIKATPIDIELWYGDQLGARTRKFLSGTDANFKKFGKIYISSLQLSMPDYTDVGNFPTGNDESFKAEIKISGDKSKMGKQSSIQTITKQVSLIFDTDAAGLSKIKGCGSIISGQSGLGAGQSWQILTITRTLDTDFVNTTTKPIFVSVSVGPNPNPGWGDLKLTVDGKVISHSVGNWNGGSGFLSGSAIIPPGSTYRASGGGRLPLEIWAELR
jgi:type II secretory pathway pseudopilin PulG